MNKITISLFGKKYEQKYYEINDTNSAQIQEWVASGKNKLQIDSAASQFPLLHTLQLFDAEKTWITIKQKDDLINVAPYPALNDCYFNLIYGSIDASSYDEGIKVDLNSRAITTNPEQMYSDTQRVYDYLQEETFFSPLCSIVLSGNKDSISSDKEYMIKTTTCFSVFEYEFNIPNQFDIDELGVLIDPYLDYYTNTDCIIPDYVLYNDVFRCGGEVFSIPIELDWAKGLVSNRMSVVAEYKFEDEKCNTLSTVLF